jgi:integrase
LSAATKNKLLVIIKRATSLAVLRRRLPFDPLAELGTYKGPTVLKELFTVPELSALVSEHARIHAIAEHAELNASIDALGKGRMEGVRAIAKAAAVHWTTIYNRLRAEADEDPWWLPACLLTYTGARAQEGLHLRWEWMKWDARIITLKRHEEFDIKSDAERNITLEPELADILRPRAKAHGWIVTDRRIREGGSGKPNKRTGEIPRDYQSAFAAYCKRVGVEIGERTVHSLRHCYITMKIARADMNLDRLRKNVGHQNIKTTQGYSELSQEYEAIVDAWPDSSLWLRRPFNAKSQGAKRGG